MDELNKSENILEVVEMLATCFSIAINQIKELTSENIQLELELEKYKEENKGLKKQIANGSNASFEAVANNFQLKEIKRTARSTREIGQEELDLKAVVLPYIRYKSLENNDVTATLLIAVENQ